MSTQRPDQTTFEKLIALGRCVDGDARIGGCQTVVEGLGAIRNRHGDAHGKGVSGAKPAARHAELAVNLSGTMATFLLQTWEARKKK